MDVKELLMSEFKAEGLELGEEAAKMACKVVFRVLPKVIIASENKYDDLLLAVLPVVEEHLMKVLEDINKADNPA